MIEINLKLLIVGDSNVGKTSLLLNYTENNFPETHLATVGVEYKIKSFEKDGFKIKLQIWDTAGEERYRAITKNFFHGSDGILFVFDITQRRTFEGIKEWIKESESAETGFQKILIGNKCDLEKERTTTKEEIEEFGKENNMYTLETSAKNSININEAFDKIIDLIFKEKTRDEIIDEYAVKHHALSIVSRRSIKKAKKSNVRCC